MKKTYLHFHIGRGGCFNNSGYKTFAGFNTIQDVLRNSNRVFYYYLIDPENEDKGLLPASEYKVTCDNNRVLCSGQEAYDIINGVKEDGIIEFDGDYDTDIVRELHDLHDDELDIIGKMIIDGVNIPYCDERDDVIRYVSAISDYVFQKYNNAVATFNADPFCVENDGQIADVALSAYNDSLEEVYKEDEDEWKDALLKLDLTSATKIYRNREMLIVFEGDF